jgi:hypothetical protein
LELIIIKVAIGMPTKDSGMLCIMPGEKKKRRREETLNCRSMEKNPPLPFQLNRENLYIADGTA